MFEKVNPSHPDKIADRIAGAIVDLTYAKARTYRPVCAVEVLIGHGKCTIINETSCPLTKKEVKTIVERIAGKQKVEYKQVPQDIHLADNQVELRCGDNGIFKGVPVTREQFMLCRVARNLYKTYTCDGKYILDGDKLIICQSNASKEYLDSIYHGAIINPLGDWKGGTNVDTGATNRKLGSDMGDSVTGGGLCLSGDTEYIGEDLKWHKIQDYQMGEKVGQWNNGVLEFVIPFEYIHNKNDNFILFQNDSKLSMELTPNHNVLIKTSKGNFIKHKAEEVAQKLENGKGNLGSIIHNFTFENKSITSLYSCVEMARLQVAFCADGTMLKNGNKKWTGRIRVKKQYKKERLRELLADFPYKETQDGEYSIFWFTPQTTEKSLYKCFKNDNDWGILYDEIYKWDGDKERKIFRTMSKENADFIQFVIASFGKVATITTNKGCYIIHELQSTSTGLKENKGCKINVIREEAKKDSYCFNVPSHNLVVRHNDKIFITGNCGKDLSKGDVSINIYAWLKAQVLKEEVQLSCAIGDTIVDGRPYTEIVAIATEFIKELGGFESLAEWGLVRHRKLGFNFERYRKYYESA